MLTWPPTSPCCAASTSAATTRCRWRSCARWWPRSATPASRPTSRAATCCSPRGRRLRVVVLSRAELAQVIGDNPYQAEPNPKYVHAMFFPAEPGPEVRESVAAAERQAAEKGGRDEATVVGRTLFLHTPGGYGRSELAARLARARGPVATGTARNWATVTKLLALSDS